MRWLFALTLALAAAAAPAAAQQVVNPNADMSVAAPAWPAERGPRVLIDQGHANFHTLDGRYAPFAALLRNDGYRVAAHDGPFTAASLAEADILVIANAAGADVGVSAFTVEEIAAVRAWIENGGALLLIADHRPFAGAAAGLGEALGIRFRDAYAVRPGNQGDDRFGTGSGLSSHIILTGAGGDPAVTELRTFTGSAFEAPAAQPLVTLGEGFLLITGPGPVAIDPTGENNASGLLQGAALELGRGRIVVMGEAAMFSSQLAGPEQRVMGIGAPGTEQNKQFALNLMHWLSRRPGY